MEDDVGIVIPAYRPDPERLATYVESLWTEIAPARLHVELDQPSRAVLTRLADTPATVHISTERRGKGAAITAGFDHLDTSILVFVDADGSTPAESLSAIIRPIREDRAELAVGSRRHPDANVIGHQTRGRRYLGDFFARLARRLLPVTLWDYQCGAKAIDRETWRSIRGHLVSPGFAWDVEFVTIAHVSGARVLEVPITWEDHPGSTVPIRGSASAFALGLLRARHRGKCLMGSRFHRRLDGFIGSSKPLISREELRGMDPPAGRT